jgi:hypothetical protein
MRIMKEYNFEIIKLMADGWAKHKDNGYQIFLDKDGRRRKISLSSGLVLSETDIVKREKKGKKRGPQPRLSAPEATSEPTLESEANPASAAETTKALN